MTCEMLRMRGSSSSSDIVGEVGRPPLPLFDLVAGGGEAGLGDRRRRPDRVVTPSSASADSASSAALRRAFCELPGFCWGTFRCCWRGADPSSASGSGAFALFAVLLRGGAGACSGSADSARPRSFPFTGLRLRCDRLGENVVRSSASDVALSSPPERRARCARRGCLRLGGLGRSSSRSSSPDSGSACSA